jgi:carbamoyl-phosphate synthase small subunit
MRGVLCLEDGFVTQGELLSYTGEVTGEVVFSTGMTGYEDALTDPSHCGQILVFAFPMIGNYHLPAGSGQSGRMMVRGLVARDVWQPDPSGSGTTRTLAQGLEDSGCPAIYGLDTRELVLHLREHGSKKGVISRVPESGLGPKEVAALRERAARFNMKRVVEEVSCHEVTFLGDETAPRGTCVLMDFGSKAAIVAALLEIGFRVCRVPPETPASEITSMHPACVLLSNGPGDPEDNAAAIETAAALLEPGTVPLFGICLGHQVIAKAAGARIAKLKYGHHGANHPVKDLKDGRILVTSQNHSFTVDDDALPKDVSVTHRNLNDGTVEGIEISHSGRLLAASIQFHPEGAPGPTCRQFWDRLTEAASVGGCVHAKD